MSLKARLTRGSVKRPVKKAAKKPVKKAANKPVQLQVREIADIPARLEFEVDGETVNVHVYRTDMEHPHSLVCSFTVTREQLDSKQRCMILYSTILAPLSEALGLY